MYIYDNMSQMPNSAVMPINEIYTMATYFIKDKTLSMVQFWQLHLLKSKQAD